MKREKIKPIPKYILKRIQKADKKRHPNPIGNTRFYAYLTKNDKELVKVTVAVRHYRKKWICKQVVIHGLDSDFCIGRDMAFHYIGGYSVGWYDMGVYSRPKWFEDGVWYINEDKSFDPWAPVVNKEYIAKFPEFKYSAYELFKDVNIIKYLRLYQAYPQLEYLMKLGLYFLYDSIQILRKLKKDVCFRKWIARHRDEIKYKHYVSAILRAYTKNIPLAQAQTFEETKKQLSNKREWREIRELFHKDLGKFFSYIAEQNTSINNYNDYLKACTALGLDMNTPKNRYPHDFKRWHDIRIDEYQSLKAKQDEEKRKELYEKFLAVAEKYTSLQQKQGAFVVIIAKSPAELMREGEILHHCVGRMGYDQKFAREETLIFFVRDKNALDTPFVMVEYSLSKHKILQCYAEHNHKPNATVMNFVNNKWLPHANKQLKKLAA